MKGKILAALIGAQLGADVMREVSRPSTTYVQPTQTRTQSYPQQAPRYQQHGGNLCGTYTHVDTVSTDCVVTTREIIAACHCKARSVGREFAYLIHRGEKSGWHNGYSCSYSVAQEYARIARRLGLYDVYPHDPDYAYERLGQAICDYVNRAQVV